MLVPWSVLAGILEWMKTNTILALLTPRREEANPHIVHYKLNISLLLFSVMAATPDTGEQFRIKLQGVDSSGVWRERERERER